MTTKPLRLDVNEQIECAWTLASRFYTDPHILEIEREKIFRRTWQLVGTLDQACGEAIVPGAGTVEGKKVKRTIYDQAFCALLEVVRRNKKHAAPKIRVEHVGMRDEQLTGEALRLARLMAHEEIEDAPGRSASCGHGSFSGDAASSRIDALLRLVSKTLTGAALGLSIHPRANRARSQSPVFANRWANERAAHFAASGQVRRRCRQSKAVDRSRFPL